MKKIFYILISFLFISCATTKTIDTNEFYFNENVNNSTAIKTSEHIEIIYEPNTELILFDVFCMPFLVSGLAVREAGRVIVYSTANITLGYMYGMFEENGFMDGLWLPNIEQTKKELEELNKIFAESDYNKYKKYTKHWAKTTLNVCRLVECVDFETNKTRILSETKFTLIYIDSIYDTVERVSKKSSLVGETIGSCTTKIVAFTPYSIGWLIGLASKK